MGAHDQSRGLLKRGLGHSYGGIFERYAICEFQKTTHFQSEAKCKTFVN